LRHHEPQRRLPGFARAGTLNPGYEQNLVRGNPVAKFAWFVGVPTLFNPRGIVLRRCTDLMRSLGDRSLSVSRPRAIPGQMFFVGVPTSRYPREDRSLSVNRPHVTQGGIVRCRLADFTRPRGARSLPVNRPHATPGGSFLFGVPTLCDPWRLLSRRFTSANAADGVVVPRMQFARAKRTYNQSRFFPTK
jgi:hypothetical protein